MDNRVLTLRMEDGRFITAPTGIWFLALWDVMNHVEKNKLFGRMEQIRDSQLRKIDEGTVTVPRKHPTLDDVKKTMRICDKSYWDGTDEEFLKSMMIKPF